jgi:diguanylate cyclase (GGDEF)-like protein/PAS domain S-box-containing protein
MVRAWGHVDTSKVSRKLNFRWLCVGFVVMFGALTAAKAGDSAFWTAFDDIDEALAAGLATVAVTVRVVRIRRSQAPGADRRPWLVWALMGAGMGMWLVGQIAWSVYEVGLGVEPPSPGWLDGVFLLSPVLVIAGLLGMLRTPAGGLSQLRGLLEGLFIAGGLLLCTWVIAIEPVAAGSAEPPIQHVINLAYPTLDAIALAAVMFVALRRREDPPAGLGLLGLGIVCIAVSDFAFWYLNATLPRFPGVTPLDTGWVAGFALIAVAALRPSARRHRAAGVIGRRLALVAPAIPASAGAALLLSVWLVEGELDSPRMLVAALAGLLIIAVVLQLIATSENRRLADDLERRVVERTAQLHSAERYYRALVQHSSDSIIVVDADQRIRHASDSVVDVLGRSAERLTGVSLDTLSAGTGRSPSEALVESAEWPDQPTRVQWPFTDDAGRTRHLEATITNMLADPDVGAFVLNTRDVTDRVALEDQLRHQAFHDPLTGLPNRALLSDRAAQAFGRAIRTQHLIGAVVVDLDGFKWVNDTQGHVAADKLLCAVGQRLEEKLRPGDTISRVGGDEFVALIESVTSIDDAREIAQRLCESIRPAFTIDGHEIAITASAGVAVATAAEKDFGRLVADADHAMYAVKAAGKNASELFDPSMHYQARDRIQLRYELERSIEAEDFSLLYQPIYVATDERLVGFEALVRWNHPERGLLAPDSFIPLAEECGLIVPLGRWVLNEAVQRASEWNRDRPRADALTIAINVSPIQLISPGFIADARQAIDACDIDPALVVLEITEAALVEDSEATIAALHALKQLGVRIAIDDFGTGYASLSYLERMPVDMLKVDRCFITATDDNARARELLKAIHDIGDTLSLQTLAEGVETRGQLDIVNDLGFELAQGFLLARPLAAEQAQALAASPTSVEVRA